MNEVLQVIESLAHEGITMVIVTHEMNFAFKVSDRIVFMEKGRVVCDDTPQAMRSGATPAGRGLSQRCFSGLTIGT